MWVVDFIDKIDSYVYGWEGVTNMYKMGILWQFIYHHKYNILTLSHQKAFHVVYHKIFSYLIRNQ